MDTHIAIVNTQLNQGPDIYDTIRLAFDRPMDRECVTCIKPHHVEQQLQRFPEGQFVAIEKANGGLVVGVAVTMRINYPPTQKPKKWLETLGDQGIPNHVPDGDWLYGVEMAVRPTYQRRGIGTALYEARFDLAKRLNLRGWYAGGMLLGYHRYQHEMTVQEYAQKVIRRELIDPTITMQLNRGFQGVGIIEDYYNEPVAGNAAVLIVWRNAEYVE